mgnify:CR=1 FL=1
MSNDETKETAAPRRSGRPRGVGRSRALAWLGGAAIAVISVLAVNALPWDDQAAVASPIEFTDVRKHTEDFVGYYNSIELTPEQELVKRQALSRIPAPCCSDKSAYTCCCPCNMAKSWWGLSHHLIANEGASADEVKAAVEGWIEIIGPKGFSGKACYTGGCVRPFHRNGCGGMNENQIVF